MTPPLLAVQGRQVLAEVLPGDSVARIQRQLMEVLGGIIRTQVGAVAPDGPFCISAYFKKTCWPVSMSRPVKTVSPAGPTTFSGIGGACR